jgi:hypothetical protein
VGSAFKNDHGSYRKNGYDEHKTDPVKSSYYKPDPIRIKTFGGPEPEQQIGAKAGVMRTPRLQRGQATSWGFVGKNFKNANHPFAHAYHHMVPWEVMSETFTLRELKLFQSAQYNINEGINLIILPCFKKIGILIGMYTHPNDHPTYTSQLTQTLRKLKNQIKGDEEKHLKSYEVEFLKMVLDLWERAEWIEIAEGGRAAMGVHVDEHKPSAMNDVVEAILGS